MKIRPYIQSDRKYCLEIFTSNTPLFFDPSELADLEFWLNGQDEGRLAYKQTELEYFFVVEQDNKVVACGGYYIPRAEQIANMVWGMVHQVEHKKGIGKELMNFRIEQIEELYPNYSISLDTTQHSFQFFEKIGFETTKITKDFYGEGLHRHDMIKNKEMKAEIDYLSINKQSWNNRTEAHLNSDFYDVAGFLKGNTSLNSIELDLLGDITGKSILHLQCHFGQDSISLSRLGADVTGVDLSDKAIESAKQIAADTNSNTKFICCDIYDLPKHLNQQFDIVFTSYGTIGWLPDLDKWANIVSQFLKPNGQFVFVEFHPVVWMFDDDFKHIAYNYFNSGAIVETESGTYADRDAPIKQEYVCWNHGMSEVLNSLIRGGLEINSVDEYDYSPYNCFNKTIEFEPKKFRIEHLNDKIPMVYSVLATKENKG